MNTEVNKNIMRGIDHKFKKLPFNQFGPWKNYWGYITTIAAFGDDDIIVKSIKPDNTALVQMFTNWEDCENFIELIEQDRRF